MTKRVHNALNGTDRYKLQRWLEAQGETIQKARLSKPEVLRRACTDLQLKLTERNLRSAATVVGVEFFPVRVKRERPATSDAIRRHEAALMRIAKALDLDISDLLPSSASTNPNGNGKVAQGELPI